MGNVHARVIDTRFRRGGQPGLSDSGLCCSRPRRSCIYSGSDNSVSCQRESGADAYKAAKSRSICIGTAADCRKQKAEARRRPQQAHFDLLVNFEFNSEQLTQAAKDNLNQFAKALQDPRLKGEKFEIDGHTDAVGAEIYNQRFSERRANAVVSYLASQGLDPSR